MSGTSPEDRTEAPTPRRLEKAREEGRVPLSREAVGAAGLAGAVLAIVASALYAYTGYGKVPKRATMSVRDHRSKPMPTSCSNGCQAVVVLNRNTR